MFGFTEDEEKRIKMWERNHNCTIEYEDAIGCKYTYCFTPTGLGMIKVVKCGCGAEYDVTEYDEW